MNSTALGAGAEKAQDIIFISEAHEEFYYEKLKEVRYQDVYHKALCYCLGINDDTRTEIFSKKIIEENKTVFMTTHNPLVLDGLDLSDDNIRLFTTDRNKNGLVEIHRVQVSEELIKMNQPLSRLWINGLLGGVPELL